MELEYWQGRLEQHFSKLRDERRIGAGGRQIFALEHGLDSHEIAALEASVREHVAKNKPLRDPLPWIAYAAEIGYLYSGEEYWQTFDSKTPEWARCGNRYWIQKCFQKFHRDFDGAKPSGRWAEHFRIICWPIAHAILPRDLQYQLARILYELRHSFSAEIFADPSILGAFIRAKSLSCTSRFQQLAQETVLLGQISAALLLEGQLGTDTSIYPPTLRRIVRDLDEKRPAREWLRGARRVAQERAKLSGLALTGEPNHKGTVSERARAQAAALGLEPRLLLRPSDKSLNFWSVEIEIPDLSNLLIKFPLFEDILVGSRCVVAGAAGSPKARGFFLHGPKRVSLVRWPKPEEVLLQFERKNAELEFLLRTECLLRPGNTWLFRIASDGIGYELRSLRVRPGEKYVVVNPGGQVKVNNQIRAVNVACTGIEAMLLDVPSAITHEWQEIFKSLGLAQAKTIEVWPAGLAAQVWDGEGRGEWLASESPCLAISSDHPLDSLYASLNETTEAVLEVKPIVPGQPVFIELPRLPVGLHTVRISGRKLISTEVEHLGDVVMQIRQAEVWDPGISRHGPLIVQMDPVLPSLEQIWESRVAVNLYGPVGRNLKCRILLFGKDGDLPSITTSLQPMALPVNSENWWMRFDKDFRRPAENHYDSAKFCELTFKAEELGAFTIRCEREFTPLRWILRRRGHSHVAQLLDDSGHTEKPTVVRFAFETPDIEEPLACGIEYDIPPKGGLYVARIESFVAAIVAPPTVRVLSDLKCMSHVEGSSHSIDSVLRMIDLVQLWSHARLPGDIFSANRLRGVLLALTSNIFRLFGGDNWQRAEEAAAYGNTSSIDFLNRAISTRREHAEIGATLKRDLCSLSKVPIKERVDCLAALAKSTFLLTSKRITIVNSKGKVVHRSDLPKVEDPKWLAELALRLASDPSEVKTWGGSELQPGLRRLLELPVLARAARFLVVAKERQCRDSIEPTSGALYRGWQWS